MPKIPIDVEQLDEIAGGASLLGAYQQYDFEGHRRLAVYPPQGAFDGRSIYEAAPDVASQAARQYFDRNPGTHVGVDVVHMGPDGNVVGTYGFMQNAPIRGAAPSFMQPQTEALLAQSSYVDRLHDEAVREHSRLTGPNADPNDEGFGFFAARDRADQAQSDTMAMLHSYTATRDATAPLDPTITSFEYRMPDPPATAPTTSEPAYAEPTFDE